MSKRPFSIIPRPKEASCTGATLIFDAAITTDDEGFGKYADVFCEYASRVNGLSLGQNSGGIMLVRDELLSSGEYTIETSEEGIALSASDDDGIVYALATLHQLITAENGKISVPACKIKDRPDTFYRALLVDLARQWHPFDTLKNYIDLCYLYKIKFIHLHFTDTQSYTLPCDSFPLLPTKDRSYTKAQIEELNRYALERNIEIIPEVDVPGHAQYLTEAYPELFANTVYESWGDKNIICVGKPGVMDNLRLLFDEVAEMFPNSRYIHIGGDEANIATWECCEHCKAFMKREGINGKYPLYTRVVKDLTDMILDIGRTPIVWEGFPREGSETISKKVIVTAWESYYHLANELVEEGFTVTNSSWKPLYIVPPTHHTVVGGRWYPKDILDWNMYTWKHWSKKTAAYEKPIVLEPADQVIGGTLCAWECNYDQDIIPVKENLAALSERLWNTSGDVDPDSFAEDLEGLLGLVDKAF